MPCYAEAIHVRANALPLHWFAIQCRNITYLRFAQAPLISALPLLRSSSQCLRFAYLRIALISPHCPRIPLLCQNHAPLSHGNTLPGPFIAIQCPYFAMPVLTSRCSASATRHLAFALLILAVPLLCFSMPSRYPTKPLPDISNQYLNKSLHRLCNSLPCLYCSIPQHQSSTSHSKAPLPLFRHWPRPL